MKKIHLFGFILLLTIMLLPACEQECRHKNVSSSKTEPTCTQNGETVYTCDDCGYSYTKNIIEPIGHVFEETVTAPTCISDGYTKYTCACGYSYTSDYVSASGHNYVDTITAPSCSEIGFTTHKCKSCNYTYVSNQTDPTDHSYTKTVTDPTCTEQGYTTYTCKACSHKYISDYTSPTEHKMVDVITPPTCKTEGYTTYSCEKCDHKYISDYTSPSEHTVVSVVTPPTCVSQGYTTYSCENCTYKYVSDQVSPIEHDLDSVITAPTCDKGGYTTYSCKNCSYVYVSDHTSPTGHDLINMIVSPNCNSQGYTIYACKNCSFSYESDYTEPIDHEMSNEQTLPTCTTEGKTVYSCANCDYTYTEILQPLGHAFTKRVTMPTLSDIGYTKYACQNEGCGFEYTGDFRFYNDLLANGAYANNSIPLAQGIDVSLNNYPSGGSIDFESIKSSGIDYVIIKAGSTYRNNYTIGGKEETFEQSYADAKAAGLDVGVYFYTYATNVNEIIQDARLLVSILDGKQFEYPVYLDLEDPSLESIDKATLTQMCVEFFTILQRAGYYTGLYVNDTWLKDCIDTETALKSFEIWYARPNPEWDAEKFGQNLGMWQYSFEGKFEGMPDIPFDMSYAYKNYPETIKNGGFNGYSSDEITFIDSAKEFVYITANSLNVRTTPNFDSGSNILGVAYLGECFEVLETTDDYVKIVFKGQQAFIVANPSYISFDHPLIEKGVTQ